MDNFDLTIIGLGFFFTAGISLLYLWQLNNFGKRIKKLEEQISQLKKDN